MMKEAILRLVRGEDLDEATAAAAMGQIMRGEASEVQISAYLTALAIKGASVAEIAGSAAAARQECVKFPRDGFGEIFDIVGTGGDGSDSFNISTASAFVVASSGVRVAKHGNRASSSKCGSADVLEALGVNIGVSPQKSAEILEQIGICFLFAQSYHASMRHAAKVRKELGFRTIFNLLGPLLNPALATQILLGVYDEALLDQLARAMQTLGLKRGLVVYGADRLDEISLSAPSKICEFCGDELKFYEISPADFGLPLCQKSDLKGGDAAQNAQIIKDIFKGHQKGAKFHAVCLNAGAGLYAAGKAKSIKEGVQLAETLLKNGRPLELLSEFIKLSNEGEK